MSDTTCTTSFWNFFNPLAGSVPGINTVNRSGGDKMDRLLSISRSQDIYPAAFLLRPKYSLEDNGAGLSIAWFDATYYVICVGDMSSDVDEDVAFDEAERLATAICAKIQQSPDTDYKVIIDPAQKIFLEPITMVTLEASYGYEVRIKVGLMVNSELYS